MMVAKMPDDLRCQKIKELEAELEQTRAELRDSRLAEREMGRQRDQKIIENSELLVGLSYAEVMALALEECVSVIEGKPTGNPFESVDYWKQILQQYHEHKARMLSGSLVPPESSSTPFLACPQCGDPNGVVDCKAPPNDSRKWKACGQCGFTALEELFMAKCVCCRKPMRISDQPRRVKEGMMCFACMAETNIRELYHLPIREKETEQ